MLHKEGEALVVVSHSVGFPNVLLLNFLTCTNDYKTFLLRLPSKQSRYSRSTAHMGKLSSVS